MNQDIVNIIAKVIGYGEKIELSLSEMGEQYLVFTEGKKLEERHNIAYIYWEIAKDYTSMCLEQLNNLLQDLDTE